MNLSRIPLYLILTFLLVGTLAPAHANPKAGDKIYLILNMTSTGDYRETHAGTYEPKGKHEVQTSDHFECNYQYRATWEVADCYDKDSDRMELNLVTDSYTFTCGGNGSTRKYDEYWIRKGPKDKLVFDRSELINSKWFYPNAQPTSMGHPHPIFSVKDRKFTITNVPNPPVYVADKCMPKCDTTTTLKDEKGSKTYRADVGTGMWAYAIAGIAASSPLGVTGQAAADMNIVKLKNEAKAAAAKAGIQLDAESLAELDNAQPASPSIVRDNSVKDKLTGTWEKPGDAFSITQTAVYQASDKDLERAAGDQLRPEPCDENDSVSSSHSGNLILNYTLSYNMEPEELEAVIIPQDGYESKWLPEGGTDEENPGNSVLVQVRLQVKGKPDKKPSQGAQFTYRLTGVSSEPGTCLNFPSREAKNTKDLRIRQEDNAEAEVKDNEMTAVTTASDLTESELVLQCYDWAAYGSLHVTAQLEDGSKLEAYLQNSKKFNYLPIPMDDNSNLIADCWEQEQGIKGKAANSDDETQPKGDGHEGDGLTLYEEYRGIMEDGQHIRCNPKKKDYFICSKLGADGDKGLNLFEILSGLEVHRKLTEEELGKDRVINRNSPEKQITQHGLIVQLDKEAKGLSQAVGNGPGTPKHTYYVTVSGDMFGGNEGPANVAHEIFHACSIHHHGYGDLVPRYWVREVDPDNPKATVIKEYPGIQIGKETYRDKNAKGIIVKIYHENGTPAVLAPLKVGDEFDFQLAVKHGEHSGDERCIMRYNCAQAYISEREKETDQDGIRYILGEGLPGDKVVGTMLCTGREGLDFNKAGRKPEPRYDSAAEGLGNCVAQICVNDKYDHVPVEAQRDGKKVIVRSSK